MFCLGSVLPVILLLSTSSLLAFILVLYAFINPPPLQPSSAFLEEEAQASVVPRLLLPLLTVATRYVPSAARYLVACVTWLWPLGILFLLPVAFVVLLYSTALIVQLYCLRDFLVGGLRGNIATDELLRRLMAAVWEAHGRAFHGYEVVGMEKLPPPGHGAFLIYYHGTLPLDAYYFIARHIILRNRVPIPVVDRFLFRLPGLQRLLRLTCALEGTVEDCANLLNPALAASNKQNHADKNTKNSSTNIQDIAQHVAEHETTKRLTFRAGEVLLLSPGGVREALFSDEYYSLLWGKRRGFARVAIKAVQPIYPVFTENIREGIRLVQYGKHWFRRLYELTRLPLGIFYGYFPVKLRTYIGDAIYPKEGETDEHLADRTREAIEDMILRYQWRPGNVVIALLQRIPCFDAWIKTKNEQNYVKLSKRRKSE